MKTISLFLTASAGRAETRAEEAGGGEFFVDRAVLAVKSCPDQNVEIQGTSR
jgi:hypothetical protein